MVLEYPCVSSTLRSYKTFRLLSINVVAGPFKAQRFDHLQLSQNTVPEIVICGLQNVAQEDKITWLYVLSKQLNYYGKFQFLVQKGQFMSHTTACLFVFVKSYLLKSIASFSTSCVELDGVMVLQDDLPEISKKCYATALAKGMDSNELGVTSVIRKCQESLRVQQLLTLLEQINFFVDQETISLFSHDEILVLGTPPADAFCNSEICSMNVRFIFTVRSNKPEFPTQSKTIELQEFVPLEIVSFGCGQCKGFIIAEVIAYSDLYEKMKTVTDNRVLLVAISPYIHVELELYAVRSKDSICSRMSLSLLDSNSFEIKPATIQIPAMRPYEPFSFELVFKNMHPTLPLSYDLYCFPSDASDLIHLWDYSNFHSRPKNLVYVYELIEKQRVKLQKSRVKHEISHLESNFYEFIISFPSSVKSKATQPSSSDIGALDSITETTEQEVSGGEMQDYNVGEYDQSSTRFIQRFNFFSYFSKSVRVSTSSFERVDFDNVYDMEVKYGADANINASKAEKEKQSRNLAHKSFNPFSRKMHEEEINSHPIHLEKWFAVSCPHAILFPGEEQRLNITINIQTSVLKVYPNVTSILIVRIKELNSDRYVTVTANVFPSLCCSSLAQLGTLSHVPILMENSPIKPFPETYVHTEAYVHTEGYVIDQLDIENLRKSFGAYKCTAKSIETVAEPHDISDSALNGHDYEVYATEWINLIFRDPQLLRNSLPKELWWLLNHAFVVLVNQYLCYKRQKKINQEFSSSNFYLLNFLKKDKIVYTNKESESQNLFTNVLKARNGHTNVESANMFLPASDDVRFEEVFLYIERGTDIPSSIPIESVLLALEIWGKSVTSALFPEEALVEAMQFPITTTSCFVFLLSLKHKLKICFLCIISLMKELLLQQYSYLREILMESNSFSEGLFEAAKKYLRCSFSLWLTRWMFGRQRLSTNAHLVISEFLKL